MTQTDIDQVIREMLPSGSRPDDTTMLERIHASLDRTMATTDAGPPMPRTRRSRRATIAIAAFAALAICAVTAVAAPVVISQLWDEDSVSPNRDVTEPGGRATSLLAAADFAKTTTDPQEIAMAEDVLRRSPPEFAVLLDPAIPVRKVVAPDINRTLIYKEVATGGFCFQIIGGEIGHGGCMADYGSSGLSVSTGFVGGSFIIEGSVARGVSKLEVLTASGAIARVQIDHGLVAWSQSTNAPPEDRAVATIATRDGRRIRNQLDTERAWCMWEQLKARVKQPGFACAHIPIG